MLCLLVSAEVHEPDDAIIQFSQQNLSVAVLQKAFYKL